MSKIQFEATVSAIGLLQLVKLPKAVSDKLPSRGMVMVDGTINGFAFQTPLEPDGKKGHWLKIDEKMLKSIDAKIGDNVKVEIEPTKDWPEPEVPSDLRKSLSADAEAKEIWDDITPMSRWDWIRWIRSTKNPETRQHRVEVACSKMKNGKRRACCFNRTECTDPEVSKRGVLIEV